MKTINLRVLYPDAYKSDYYVEVPDEVADAIAEESRAEDIASCSGCFRRKKSMSEN